VLKLFSYFRIFFEKYFSNSKFLWILLLCGVSFLISCQIVVGQELPPIDNFTPLNYGAENQNWGISQSKQNHIYAANNGGLLEYNGAVWRLYGSPNGSTIRSVKAIDDLIYTGCYMEFGFWKKNVFGSLSYNSISNNLTFPLLEDEEFWNIVELDDWVLFQSLERIYIYNSSDKSVKVIESRSTKAHLFNFQGTIFFHSTNKGLFKIENGESILVTEDAIFKESMVLGIFSIDDKPLIVTEKGEFYFLEDGNITRWNIPLNQKLGAINVYSSLQLRDQSVVLGTISNGIYHIDSEGRTVRKINQEKGLNNNTVLAIYEDVEQNLWLALDNGISVINMDSPFNEYIDKNGELGVVYASAVFKEHLYLGTNQGLFYKRVDADGDFQFIEGSQGQVWLLKIIDDILFCGHNNGTYSVNQNRVELISDFPGTWDLKPIPNNENLLLQGNFNGLSVLSKDNGKWKLRNVIEGFDISSRFFEFIGENQIAINRELKGIFKLNLDPKYTKVIEIKNEASKGVGASLVRYRDEVLYTCNNGIFRFDKSQNKFVTDSTLNKVFYGYSNDPVGIFIPDTQKILVF